MNDWEFRKYLQPIAHGEEPEKPPVQEPLQARKRPAQKEPPAKPPDKAKRSTRQIEAPTVRRKAL